MTKFYPNKSLVFNTIATMLLLLSMHQETFAQDIILKYASDYYLCESNEFSFNIDNTDLLIAEGDQIVLTLDCHQEYLPGSNTFLEESDISNLGMPEFIFTESDIKPSINLTIKLNGDCHALECIENGLLPTIKATIYTKTSTVEETFEYELDESLVLINSISDIEMFADRGQTITREVSIRNTKPGRRDQLIFKDQHSPYQDIMLSHGTIISDTNNIIEVLLTGNDFLSLGNNDEYFDFNESITIIETIYLDPCNYELSTLTSKLLIDASCENNCPERTDIKYAAIKINEEFPDSLELVFEPFEDPPLCLCNDFTQKQGLYITNPSNYSNALDLNIKLTQNGTGTFFTNNEITIESGGNIRVLASILSEEEDQECIDIESYSESSFTIDSIPPNTTIVVSWDVLYCYEEGKYSSINDWTYKYDYTQDCSSFFTQFQSNSEQANTDIHYQLDTELDASFILNYQETKQAHFVIDSEILKSEEGQLEIEFFMLCLFSVDDNIWILDNKAPSSTNITKNNDITHVQLIYDLPFEKTVDTLFFDITLDCLDYCDKSPVLIKETITTCEDNCPTLKPKFVIQSVASFNQNEFCSDACRIQDCQQSSIFVDCEFPIEETKVEGYYASSFEVKRINFGLGDDNNNNCHETQEEYDDQFVRSDRVTYGDTIKLSVDGKLILDFPSAEFAFTAIIFDLNLDSIEGISNLLLEAQTYSILDPSSFNLVDADLRFRDHSTLKNYETSNINLKYFGGPASPYVEFDDELKSVLGLEDNFTFTESDSFHLELNFVLDYNYRSLSGEYGIIKLNITPKIFAYNEPDPNFDFLFHCDCDSQSLEFANIKHESVGNNAARLESCEGETVNQGLTRQLLLGVKPNFFINEERNLLTLTEIGIAKFEGIGLATTFINEFVYDCQSNDTPFIIESNSFESDYIVISDKNALIGYYLFDPTKYVNHDTLESAAININYNYVNESCLFEGSVVYSESFQLKGTFVHNSEDYLFNERVRIDGKHPRLNTVYTDDCEYSIFDNTISQNFLLYNKPGSLSSDAQHAWIKFISSTGNIQDIQLINNQNGTEYTSSNQLFDLNTLPAGDTLNLRLQASINSCDVEELKIIYGWSCDEYLAFEDACVRDTNLCSFHLAPGNLDLNISNEDVVTDLCEVFEPISIDIINPGLGHSYDHILTLDLPIGLEYIPGTSILETALSNNNIALPDPEVNFNQLTYKFNELTELFLEGLVGINSEPFNTFQLSAQFFPSCGFISGDRIKCFAQVHSGCKDELVKDASLGPRLIIRNDEDSLGLNMDLDIIKLESCPEYYEVLISNPGPVVWDSLLININLPEAIEYEIGSCASPSGDCIPEIFQNNIRITDIKLDSSETISLKILSTNLKSCEDQVLEVSISQNIKEYCAALDTTCSYYLLESYDELVLEYDNPTIVIEEASFEFTEFNTNSGNLVFDILCLDHPLDQTVSFELYHDIDCNDIITDIDTLIDTFNKDISLGSGKTESFSQNLNEINLESVCKMIIKISDLNNCVCYGSVAQVTIDTEIEHYYEVCHGESITLSSSFDSSFQFEWQDIDTLGCIHCAENSFSFENPGNSNSQLALSLLVNKNDACKIIEIFNIVVFPQLKIINEDETICLGDTLNILASSSEKYDWSGPDIIDQTAQGITVSPTASTYYYLELEDDNQCISIDSIYVTVLSYEELDLGNDISICEGSHIKLKASDNPDLDYFWSPPSYFDDPYSPNPMIVIEETGYYYVDISNSACVIRDSILINFLDTIHTAIPSEVNACKNETFQINLDPQFSYDWFPVFSNMCLNDNCSSVELTLTFNQEFLVVVITENVCQDNFYLEVIIDGESGTFITTDTLCEGEQVLFNGVFYNKTGMYCDTLINDTICPQVQCLDLFVKPTDDITETVEICDGEEYIFGNNSYTENTLICIDAINSFGCDSTYCLDLIVNDIPEINLSEYNNIEIEGSTVEISELNNYQNYQWISNAELECNVCASTSFVIEEDAELTLIVTDENGCQNQTEVFIEFRQSCRLEELLIPDAITPNGNGRNDKFRIVNFRNDASEVNIKVFNRWGEKLYEENGNGGWDGTYKNEQAPEGVYLYIIEVTCENDRTQLFKGDLTILR